MDYWIEAELPVGALVYVGRAGHNQMAAYGGQKYGGGSFRFRLCQSPEIAFTTMKRMCGTEADSGATNL